MVITANTVVSLRYIMKNSEGEEIENTTQGPVVQYLHGAGKIMAPLEDSLTGLTTGDQRSITIEVPGKFFIDIEIAGVREATPEELLAGEPIKENCGPGCCC